MYAASCLRLLPSAEHLEDSLTLLHASVIHPPRGRAAVRLSGPHSGALGISSLELSPITGGKTHDWTFAVSVGTRAFLGTRFHFSWSRIEGKTHVEL